MKKLALNTVENSRKTLARLLREYNSDAIEHQKFRNLCFGFTTFLSFFKQEADLRIEKRINDLAEEIQEIRMGRDAKIRK